jgi:hypothetical protein
MKFTRRTATRALTLVAAGGVVLGMSATALAAAPPYEPDPTDQIGQLLLYNAAGNLVTSGNISDGPIAAFAVASSDDPQTANNHATLYAYTPVNGVNPQLWTGHAISGSTAFPVASPASIAAAGTHRPVVSLTATDGSFSDYIADVPNNDTTTAYAGLYQLRIKTAGNDPKFWAADIQVNPSSGAWTLVYPVLAPTTTALSASPASPATAPAAAITLTATVTANATGTVTFTNTDTSTQVGTTQTLPGTASNTAQVTIPAGLAVGTHHYSASYSPSVGALFAGSGGTLTYQVNNAPADVTTTSLSVTPLPTTVGDSFTLSSHVADTTAPASVPAGSVTWTDGATQIAGPVAVDAAGNASTAAGSFGLIAGSHSITAHFTPTNPAVFNGSDSTAVSFSLSPAAGDPCLNTPTTAGDPSTAPYPADSRTNLCVSDGTAVTTVPRGNLFISTPYTPANPFNLGTMTLSSDGTYLHTGPAHFGTATLPTAGNPYPGVTIIDTRSAGEGWTAAVKSGDFTHGTDKINACNLGFTNVHPLYIPGNAINSTSKAVTTTDVPNGGTGGIAAAGAACSTGLAGSGAGHTFASIAGAPTNPSGGTGSVYVYGDMDLYAPTSTPAGLYTATVTFTIF